MKIKAFFIIRLSGRMVILGEWLFAPTKWDAIHRIHSTQIYFTPFGFCFDVDLSGITPLPMGIPSLRDYRSSSN